MYLFSPIFGRKFQISSWKKVPRIIVVLSSRVGIKPRFYHKAQPGGFYGFYEGGFLGFYGFYAGFINLNVYH